MGFLKNLLGLGVAAGAAYAAVKVAEKYNEKKNAGGDANDTVYTVKEAAREVYTETASLVKEKAPEVKEKVMAAAAAAQEKAPEVIEKVKGVAEDAINSLRGEKTPAEPEEAAEPQEPAETAQAPDCEAPQE